MADIDDVDARMGQGTHEYREVAGRLPNSCADCGQSREHVLHVDHPHKFQGSKTTASCDRCGMLRIHSNHRGLDYDAPKQETIAEEAARIVYGDREQAYDDPNVNFEKIAHMWNGLFLRKLKPDQRITPLDVALAFVLLKVSRESHKPQRDNRVDIIGYILCGDRIVNSNATE